MENNASKLSDLRILRSQMKAISAKESKEENSDFTEKNSKLKNKENVTGVTIKRENSEDDFKEYAETAMNELLGWYGYTNNNNKISKKLGMMPHSNATNSEENKTDTNGKVGSNGSNGGANVMQRRGLESRRSSGDSSGTESPKSTEMCGWCGKSVDDPAVLSSNDATFCSEMCFSQSRRASFKKNKTCDWCKHVRHTVSYVDFQDGASQLQFCSDKCLNQYKMHIFCRETRAHLEMHPHLLTDESTSGLITPDLWMRNCRSPGSSSPVTPVTPLSEEPQQTSPLPLITVAHPSKLLAMDATTSLLTEKDATNSRSTRKRARKRIIQGLNKVELPQLAQNAQSSQIAQDLSIRRQINCPETNTKEFPELSSRLASAAPSTNNIPNLRRQNGGINVFPHEFTTNRPNPQPFSFFSSSSASQPANPASVLPPVTVMVPYPVILPVPVPIPIPLPISAFLHAANANSRLQNQQNQQSHQNHPDNQSEEVISTITSETLPKSQSDDEEIVVDDDSRLNLNSDSNDVHLNSPVDAPVIPDKETFTPIRLRKRKTAESTTTANTTATKVSENVNYKHKKTLSV